MSNRLTKGKALVGQVGVDDRTGVHLGSTTVRVRDYTKELTFTAAGSTVETDSGYDLPTYGVLRGLSVLVTAASTAGGALHVGLLSSESGGDQDGFAISVGTSTVGIKGPKFTTSTSGATGSFAVSNTYGALISAFSSGSTGADDPGFAVVKPHYADSVTSKSISITTNSSGTTFAARVFLHLTELTTA